MTRIVKQNLEEVRMAIEMWIYENLTRERTWEDLKWQFKMDFEVLPDSDLMFLFWKIFREFIAMGRIESLPNGVFILSNYAETTEKRKVYKGRSSSRTYALKEE
jgi:hypothetical protein